MKTNMKNIIVCFVTAFVLITIISVPISANPFITVASDSEYDVLEKGEILLDDNKKIYISCNSRGEYEFLFENKKLCKERIIDGSVEKEYLKTCEKAVVDSKDKAIDIVKQVFADQCKEGKGWFLGSSLYMKIEAYYSTKSTSYGIGYKVNYVVARSTVSNGTVIDTKYLNTSAWSTSEYGTAFGQTRNINILSASNPYYDYGMSGYPYLISGMDLAANLNINAHRPSGSSYNYIVEALIFRN